MAEVGQLDVLAAGDAVLAASRTTRGGNQQSCSNAMARHGDVMWRSRSRWLLSCSQARSAWYWPSRPGLVLGPGGQCRAGPGSVADLPQHAQRLLGGRVGRGELPAPKLNRGAAEDGHGELLPPPRAGRQLDGLAEGLSGRVETSGEVAGPAQPGQPGTAGPVVPAAVGLQQRSGNQLTNQRADLTVLDRLCPRHLPGRGQVEPPGEYAQPAEHNRGVSRQQRMTPGRHPETPAAAGSARTSPADHQEKTSDHASLIAMLLMPQEANHDPEHGGGRHSMPNRFPAEGHQRLRRDPRSLTRTGLVPAPGPPLRLRRGV